MSDGIRPVDREGWIPRPHEVVRSRRREGEGDANGEGARDFEQDLAHDDALRPAARRSNRDEAAQPDERSEETPRRNRREDGLGGDLDLLA